MTDFKKYGWKVNEANLSTLPPEAPKAAKDLTKWLTLEGRRSSLAEWLGCVSDDGRIHGKFWHIGAWTHRMSHSSPNQANIMSAFHGTPKTAVEEVKAKYDGELRACWGSDNYLVGCDAEGIQLRILAHYMKSEAYVKAITEGDKATKTDIHNLNKKALGSVCKDRDTAKTWIYAFLLGASKTKQAEILKCSVGQAANAEKNFLEALTELKKIKTLMIPKDAMRGYFVGLDGRKVACDSEHHMLAGYLQNGEKVVMSKWILKWTQRASEEGLWYKLVDIVHDETQTEVKTKEDGERLLDIQRQTMVEVGEELGLFCPLAADGNVGLNWAETH